MSWETLKEPKWLVQKNNPVLVGNKLYFISKNYVWNFDYMANTWRTVPNVKLSNIMSVSHSVIVNDTMFIFSSFVKKLQLTLVDIVLQEIVSEDVEHHGDIWPSTFKVKSVWTHYLKAREAIVIYGLFRGSSTPQLYTLDPYTLTFTSHKQSALPRMEYGSASTATHDTIYFFGRHKRNDPKSSLIILRAQRDNFVWSHLAQHALQSRQGSSLCKVGSRLFVYGGEKFDLNIKRRTRDLEYFDLKEERWYDCADRKNGFTMIGAHVSMAWHSVFCIQGKGMFVASAKNGWHWIKPHDTASPVIDSKPN